MRLLLDTSVYLWWLADSRRLGRAARERIAAASQVYVSAASIWESEQRITARALEADVRELARGITASGFIELPVTADHAATAARLPQGAGDPFDRLLVAQAMHEPMHFLTANEQLKPYSELVHLA